MDPNEAWIAVRIDGQWTDGLYACETLGSDNLVAKGLPSLGDVNSDHR